MFTDYEHYIHLSRYSRWNDTHNRREYWEETVSRYVDFFSSKFDTYPRDIIYNAILNKEVMPSMRALMSAGKALDAHEVSAYNCSYIPIDHIRAFDETMYILMCGTGVGFSVEKKYTDKLPVINDTLKPVDTTISVSDSKIGWATAFKQLLSLLYVGSIPTIDYTKIRPAGSPLKTFGGRASGPDPLMELFNFCIVIFKGAAGRRLTTIEVHDIVCKIADIVVVGGVRRSALISLSDINDISMQKAKSGNWWEPMQSPYRALANNSAVYDTVPSMDIFMKEWMSLYESKSGERGIFNRSSTIIKAKETARRDAEYDFGTNPCGEIILRPNGFCNLSEVIIRSYDTVETLKKKVEVATIIGTFQSTLTNFKYLRPIWKRNAEEERLLGVSLTGIMDNASFSTACNHEELKETLDTLKQHVIKTNKKWAAKIGINESASITTVKPSGTVSQLVNSSSGIHQRHSKFYIRRVRSSNSDPLTQFMISMGFPHEADITKPDTTTIFSFPIKSPEQSICRDEINAIKQLEHYKIVRDFWCEHNPSITVYVKEYEWMEVGAWVYKNFNSIGGVSFLPYSEHVYQQAPYDEISEDNYIKLLDAMPKDIKWNDLSKIENIDTLMSTQELACAAGGCDL